MKKLLPSVGMMAILAMPVVAFGLSASHSGYVIHDGAGPGDLTGATTYDAYLILDHIQQDPFYPYDSTKQYTVVLSTTVTAFNNVGIPWTMAFGVGALSIYEDDPNTGTAADYGNLATFSDGTEILIADVENHGGFRVDLTCNPYTVNGEIMFTGGAGIGNLPGSNCTMVMNDFDSYETPCGVSPPAGFVEAYDGLWNLQCVTPVENTAWGSVKALYR